MAKIYAARDFLQITDRVYKVAGWNYNIKSINPKHRQLQATYYWTSNVLFMLIILQSFAFLFLNIGKPGKFLDVTEIILCIGFMIMLILKSYFVVYRNRTVLTEMIDDLDAVIPRSQHLQEQFGIRLYCGRTRLVSIICSVTYSSLLASFIAMPILENILGAINGVHAKWELPFKFYFPFDPTRDFVYPALYAYESWLCFKCAIEVLGSDLLFCNLTSIITMRLDILRTELVEVDASKSDAGVAKLREHAEIHQKLYEVNEKLEALFSFSLLVDLLASTIITCLAAFNAFLGVKGFPLLKFIVCFFASLFRIGMQCYHVDRLSRASLRLADGAYENLWYDGSQTYKRTLLFIIMRAQKPLRITAYKFQALSLESFTHFVRSSYSLFALLQTMYHGDA